MKKNSIVRIATVFVFSSSVSMAQDYKQCFQILEGGKFDTSIIDSSRSKKSFAHSWFCRQSYESNSSEKSFNMEAAYKTITGSFDYSKDTHNEYQSSFCQESTNSEDIAESTHILRQIASPAVIDAWKDCIGDNNSGLVCDATQASENELRLEITIKPSEHNDLENAKVLTDNFEFVFESEMDWSGPLNEGATKLLQLRRLDSIKPALIQIDGKMEDTTATCDYRVPPQDKRFALDFERINLMSLIHPKKMPSGVVATGFTTQKICTVRVTESLVVNRSTVGADKTSIDVAYTCNRPDHHYTCGGGPWTIATNASYTSSVNAKISVSSGRLIIGDVVDSGYNGETACGAKITDYIKSLQGTALDIE